jgi:hypothetical protein
MDTITSFHQSGNRYRFLRFIGAIFTLIGAVELAIGGLLLVFGLYTLLAGTTVELPPGAGPIGARQVRAVFLTGGLGGTLSLLWSCAILLSGLYLIALGGVIRLLIHLEVNMRVFAKSLDKIRMRLESSGEGVETFFRS